MRFKIQKKNIPFFILGFFGILISFISLYNHYSFKTFTYDYANYNFAFWDYSHFRLSPLPTFRGNFLQDHFSFTLMYFIPVYWILNWLTGTYTLIIIQDALILVAAWYSHKLIKLKTENLWLTSGVILYFFLLFGRYSAFGTDVNLAIMSACFIPVFLYYFEVKKYLVALIILILSLFSRENIPIWFVFIFAVLIITHWKDKKAVLFSIIGIFISIAFFVLLFKVFIPNLETPGVEYALFNYAALGSGPGEAIAYIIQHPIEAVKLFFINHLENPEYNKVKLEFYLVYMVSGGFVLFAKPKYFIWFIPIVAQKVLNDDPFRWGLATYYSAEVVTLLPLSVFLALSSFKSKQLQNILVGIVCAASLGTTIHKMDSNNQEIPWTFYKKKIKFYDKSFYETPFNIKQVNQILKKIPKDAKVSSSNVITPHIAQRQFIYFFPAVNDAEYIVFSMNDNNYLLSAEENDKHRYKYLNSPNWEIVEKDYPVFLLQKRTTPLESTDNSTPIWGAIDTIVGNFELTDNESEFVLLSNNEPADFIANRSDKVFRSGNYSICLGKENPYSKGITFKNIEAIKKLEISVWVKGISDNAFIVFDSKEGFYRNSNAVETTDNEGWKKLTLSFNFHNIQKSPNSILYLWNAGEEPIYFDDLQIAVKYW